MIGEDASNDACGNALLKTPRIRSNWSPTRRACFSPASLRITKWLVLTRTQLSFLAKAQGGFQLR